MKENKNNANLPSGWTFLSNHAHVLFCVDQDPDIVLREVAVAVGITERAVQRIIAELIDAKALSKVKQGRRNHYKINRRLRLRHPIESHRTLGQLLEFASRKTGTPT